MMSSRVLPALAAKTDEARPAQSASADGATPARINTTGKVLSLPVPLKANGEALGEIIVKIGTDDAVTVPKATLIELMRKQLDEPSTKKLQDIADSGGSVGVGEVKAAGFDVRFDPGMMELVFEAGVDQRPTGEISIGGYSNRRLHRSAASVAPSPFSGYVNLFGGVDHQWASGVSREETSLRLGIESVFRFWNIVVENELHYDGKVDLFNCPVGARCVGQHEAGWKRRGTRGIYDLPDSLLRFQFGDIAAMTGSFQSAPDVLGIGIEHSPHKLAPGDSIKPTGRSSFRIERPSEIDVMVNGAVLQRLRLGPGNYNLRDLPLQAGANDIELVIMDDTGERRTLSFKSFFDNNLLAKGRSEWSISAGMPSYLRDNERIYRHNEYYGTGFLRYGIADSVTAEVHAQGDTHVGMGGLGVFAALPYGFININGSVSTSGSGIGYAGGISYDLINFSGLMTAITGARESLRLSAEHRSTDYRTPGEFQATASGILFPQYNYSWRFTGAYSVPITDKVSATLSARYQIGNDKAFKTSPLAVTGDRYGLDLTLSSSLTSWASASLSVGYQNDSFLRDFTNTQSDKGDFRVGFRINVRPTERSRVSGSYDTINSMGLVSAAMQERRGSDRWDANADFGRYGYDDRTTAGASVGYAGNRMEARLTHTSGIDGISRDRFDPSAGEQRTSARVGAAIAFAGGKLAVGAPIRGNAFAIVDTHKSIGGKPLVVGNKDEPRAKSSLLGPALVTDLPAYVPSSLEVDVDDLPTGYSLGQGGFDLFAPYRGGYALTVGSSFSVSAFGTLHKANGEPVALLTGVAALQGNASKQVSVFTNAAGKFGAEGLGPGRWILEMATEDEPTRFAFDIPEGANGLVQLGTLKPIERGK
jgi:outer membrane usher protein